jgi:hypothetical protein
MVIGAQLSMLAYYLLKKMIRNLYDFMKCHGLLSLKILTYQI